MTNESFQQNMLVWLAAQMTCDVFNKQLNQKNQTKKTIAYKHNRKTKI